MPAFRWWEKDRDTAIVTNHPHDAEELERRHSDGQGLLHADGASRANILSGDAPHSMLTMSTALTRRRPIGRDYSAYFARPYAVARTFALALADIGRERRAARSQVRDDVRPRIVRPRSYALVRAWGTIVQRDLQVATVVGDILAGRPVIYTTFLAYDEVAHHSGIERHDALAVLRDLDRQIARIATAAREAPRPYRLVVLSDHGQSQGETFLDRYGESLEDLVRAASDTESMIAVTEGGDDSLAYLSAGLTEVARDDTAAAKTVRAATRGRLADGAVALDSDARGDIEEAHGEEIPELSVMASGCLGLITFPRLPGRVTIERLEALHPKLLPALRDHPGIGFVLVRSESRGAMAIGAGGCQLPRRGHGRGRGPAGAVRAQRRQACPPHRRLPALPGPGPQQHLLGGLRRGRGLRGAGRLTRGNGRPTEPSDGPAPGGPPLAGGGGGRSRSGPPDLPLLAGGPRAGGLRRERGLLAGGEDPDLDLRGELGAAALELARRRDQVAAAEPRESDREQRPPVDRDRDPRLQDRGRAGGPLGIEMAGPERRSPAPDREQREVEPARQIRHPLEEVGVAGEVGPAGPREHEPDRLRVIGAEPPAAAVLGLDRGDLDPGDRLRFPRLELGDRGEAAPPRNPPAPRGARIGVRVPRRRSEGRSVWSWWRWEIRIASRSAAESRAGAGPWRRRWASRERSTGSVRNRAPSSSSSTVAWPT